MASPSSRSHHPGAGGGGSGDKKSVFVDLTQVDDSSDDDDDFNVDELIRKYKGGVPSSSSSPPRSTGAARAGTLSSSGGGSSRKETTNKNSSTPGSSKKRLRLDVGGDNDNTDGQYEYASAMMSSGGENLGAVATTAAAMPPMEGDPIATADAIANAVVFGGGSDGVFSPSSAMGTGTTSNTSHPKKRKRDDCNVDGQVSVIHIDDSDDDDDEVLRGGNTASAYDPILELSDRVRQFLSSVGITTAEKLLARPAHIIKDQYAKWKETQGLPQSKEAGLSAAVGSWKEKIRAIAMMQIADNPLDFLPQQAPKFLASISIGTPEEFLKSNNIFLARNYIEFRKNDNMEPFSKPMSQAEAHVAGWKSLLGCGIRAKSYASRSATVVSVDAVDPIRLLPDTARSFLTSINVKTAQALLAYPFAQLVSRYASWQEERGQPAVQTTTLGSRITNWRSELKTAINMESSSPSDHFLYLQPTCQQFLKDIGINDAQTFRDTPISTLSAQFVRWRDDNNLPALSSNNGVGSTISGWKKSIRPSFQPKSSSRSSDNASYVTPAIVDGTKSPLDVLGSRTREFLNSVGADTAEKLLAWSTKDLILMYEQWRNQQGQSVMTECSILQAVASWKTEVRRILKIANAADPLEMVPQNFRSFLSWSGIAEPKDFLDDDSNELVLKLAEWREANNMPPLSTKSKGLEHVLSDWKTMLRFGLEWKGTTVADNNRSTVQEQLSNDKTYTNRNALSDERLAFSNGKVPSNNDGDSEGFGSVGPQGKDFLPTSEEKGSNDTEMTCMGAVNDHTPAFRTVATDREAGSNDPYSALPRIDQQFLLSVGMHDADDFLACSSDDLGPRLASWLNDLGQPALSDPSTYVSSLQQKVQMDREAMDSTDRRNMPDFPDYNDESTNLAASTGLKPCPLEQRARLTAAKTASPSWRGPKQIAMKSTMNRRPGQPVSVSPQEQSNLGPNTTAKQGLPLAEAPTNNCHLPMHVEEAMEKVEGSSRSYIDTTTGLPVLEFSTHDKQQSGVVHDFRVHAAPSTIVGAGLGAFLTFLGSRQTTGTKSRLPNATLSLLPGRRIDLGKYGPHRDLDRKIYEVFEIKSFLFSFEPCEWAWDVQICGRDQAIDITDDETGMIHAKARDTCLVYVNETGNVDYLTPNIHSEQVGPPTARNIHYFYESDSQLRKGEAIELLINYKEMYEEVRERKGYGKRNRSGATKSDAHLPSRFDRNFVSRDDLRDIFLSLGAKRLSSLMEFLVSTKESLVAVVESLLDHLKTSRNPTSVPYAQQIVALRRMGWLQPLIEKQLSRLKKAGVTTPETTAVIEENLPKLGWDSWSTLWGELEKNPDLKDKRGVNIFRSLQEEMTEEVFYSMLVALPYPLDEATWCNVGTRLMKDLCLAVVASSLSPTIENGEEELLEYFKSRSLTAANEILNPTTVDDLSFEAGGVWKRYTLENRAIVKSESPGTKCVLVNRHSTPSMPEPVILNSGNLDGIEVCQLWYLVRQVIVVLDAFAQFRPSTDKSHEITLSVMKELDIDDSTFRMFSFKVAVGPEDSAYQGKKKFTNAELQKSLDRWKLEADPAWPANEEVVEDDDDVFGQNQQGASSKENRSVSSKQNKVKRKKNDTSNKAKAKISRPGFNVLPSGVELGEHHTPFEPLEGGWPDGWTRIVVQRKAGVSVGHLDRYWFSPIERFKLRSMVEVLKFVAFLAECNGDEKEAKRLLKSGAIPKKNPAKTKTTNNQKKSPPPSATVEAGTTTEKKKSKASSSSLVEEPEQQLQLTESTSSTSEPELVDLTDDSEDNKSNNNNNKSPHNDDRDDEAPDIPPEAEI